MEGGERLEEEREEARKVKMHAAHYIVRAPATWRRREHLYDSL